MSLGVLSSGFNTRGTEFVIDCANKIIAPVHIKMCYITMVNNGRCRKEIKITLTSLEDVCERRCAFAGRVISKLHARHHKRSNQYVIKVTGTSF